MGNVVSVSASAAQRSIRLQYAGDRCERYALFTLDTGEVYWRLDEFLSSGAPGAPERWTACHGRLSTSEVARRLPEHADLVLEWTRQEIALGTIVTDDIFRAMRRRESLDRLRRELDETLAD